MTSTTETPCPTCAGNGEIADAPRYKTSTPCPDCAPESTPAATDAELYAALLEQCGRRYFPIKGSEARRAKIESHPTIAKMLEATSELSALLEREAMTVPLQTVSRESTLDRYDFSSFISTTLLRLNSVAGVPEYVLSERCEKLHAPSVAALQAIVGQYLETKSTPLVARAFRGGWDRVQHRDWVVITEVKLANPTGYGENGVLNGPYFSITAEGLNKDGRRSKTTRTVQFTLEEATSLFSLVVRELPAEAKPRKASRAELEAELEALRSRIDLDQIKVKTAADDAAESD